VPVRFKGDPSRRIFAPIRFLLAGSLCPDHGEFLPLDLRPAADLCREPGSPEEIEDLPDARQFRNDDEDPPSGREDPGKIREEPPDDLPAALAPVQRPLEPVVEPVPGPRGEVGRIEEDQVELPPDSRSEVHPENAHAGRECQPAGVGIHIGGHDEGDLPREVAGDVAASGPQLQNPVGWARLGEGGIEEEEGVLPDRVDLAGVGVHLHHAGDLGEVPEGEGLGAEAECLRREGRDHPFHVIAPEDPPP